MIRAVLIIDVQYPGMKKAWVGLLVADDSSNYWTPYHKLYHNDNRDQQPAGQLELYLSDFTGLARPPLAYCRPSAAELAAGIRRSAPPSL
jgi:hypothetical protein